MGSGHILVYAFDVLMQIYESEGYSARDAAKLVLEKNLYGIDIDDRAYQLSYFALMMKARQYDKRLFTRHIEPNICAVQESNGLHVREYEGERLSLLDLPRSVAEYLIEVFHDAKEYGSLLNVRDDQYDALSVYLEELKREGASNLLLLGWLNNISERMPALIKQAKIMSMKYDVVVTNPPYMGSSGMGGKLLEFVKNNYPDSKLDLFAVFIECCGKMIKQNRFQAMITQHAWMFLSSYENLRRKLLSISTVNMLHLGARAFEEIGGEVVQTSSFVFRKSQVSDYKGIYCRLLEPVTQYGKEEMFLAGENRYQTMQENFIHIPGIPFAYWISEKISNAFLWRSLYDLSYSTSQNKTGNNDRFLRKHWEINNNKFGNNQWIFYAKGGEYRRWWGNLIEMIDWTPEARDIYQFGDGSHASQIIKEEFWYKKGITWGIIAQTSFRVLPEYATFDMQGSSVFITNENDFMSIIGFLNTKVAQSMLNILNTTLALQVRDVRNLPFDKKRLLPRQAQVDEFVCDSIEISKRDWDGFETSWDFKRHPLVAYSYLEAEREVPAIGNSGGLESRVATYRSIELAYEAWEHEAAERFNILKTNEEELNRIFIGIYGLQDELTPEVEDKDVTVRRADLGREIRSLISYAVGCMFGRYSLDVDGLAYAGGDWDGSKYKTFIPDADNCIPITDEEYFEDDIVGRLVAFIRTVYGAETLEENLEFIANALGNRGNTSREIIRNYFLNDFFKNHCQIFQKRPIYWLFDSGKQNGFKALVYMHRWNADTIGNVRVEYLHRTQRVYEKEIARMQETMDNSRNPREVAAAEKRKEKLVKQLKEARDYDAKIAHLALSRIDIDLDDGVKVNYEKVQTGQDKKKIEILAGI